MIGTASAEENKRLRRELREARAALRAAQRELWRIYHAANKGHLKVTRTLDKTHG